MNFDNAARLTVGFVPGVTLRKWRDIWAQRYRAVLDVMEVPDEQQVAVVQDGSVDMCFLRLPIDRDGLHVIPLYDDLTVAWVSKEHPIAAFDEITTAELTDEDIIYQHSQVAIDRVLAGAVLQVPMSVARTINRRDLVYRVITDAEPSRVALTWRVDNENPLIEEFIGVVRGRTVNSSRSAQPPKTSTKEKGSAATAKKKPPAKAIKKWRR